MVERIEQGMPSGTIGLKASGKLTADDYREVMEPALQEAIEGGEARVLFLLTDFDGLEPSAAIEDIKTGFKVEVLHRDAWKRLALVTDEDWVAKAMHLFAWLVPGEMKTFEPDQLAEAKSWVAA
jgi:hypothetical protein